MVDRIRGLVVTPLERVAFKTLDAAVPALGQLGNIISALPRLRHFARVPTFITHEHFAASEPKTGPIGPSQNELYESRSLHGG